MNTEITPVILVSNEIYWLPFVLETVRGLFKRYVIYDVGSTDGTREVIEKFYEAEKNRAEFFIRLLPMCDPEIQGIFRNSMISEAKSDWYFILDGDELYERQKLNKRLNTIDLNVEKGKIYGVGKRTEFNPELTHCYDIQRGHHRLYHRTAIWKGTHPGEEPCTQQKSSTEFDIDIMCYHMHNALRSPKETEVPGRMKRKKQKSYHPGEPTVPFDLLKTLPLLRTNFGFPICPALEELRKNNVD